MNELARATASPRTGVQGWHFSHWITGLLLTPLTMPGARAATDGWQVYPGKREG